MHQKKETKDMLESKPEFEAFSTRHGVKLQHIRADNATGVVVRPVVSYLRVVGLFPTQWTGSVLSRCV
jgi:hypothetical protein